MKKLKYQINSEISRRIFNEKTSFEFKICLTKTKEKFIVKKYFNLFLKNIHFPSIVGFLSIKPRTSFNSLLIQKSVYFLKDKKIFINKKKFFKLQNVNIISNSFVSRLLCILVKIFFLRE
jgi:hypothetical protein